MSVSYAGQAQQRLPIAETFGSVQGEGVYTGTPMFFVRLAGCNVGKYEFPNPDEDRHLANSKAFNIYHSVCTTIDKQRFLCDTDYLKKFEATPSELLLAAGSYKHMCITGGEPFLHDLTALVKLAHEADVVTHIETSGTKPITFGDGVYSPGIWITCCPKEGFNTLLLGNRLVNEWKFLVGPGFNVALIEQMAKLDTHRRPIFLQPIGDVNTHLEANIAMCLELLKTHPEWKLSAQLHKFISVR